MKEVLAVAVSAGPAVGALRLTVSAAGRYAFGVRPIGAAFLAWSQTAWPLVATNPAPPPPTSRRRSSG